VTLKVRITLFFHKNLLINLYQRAEIPIGVIIRVAQAASSILATNLAL